MIEFPVNLNHLETMGLLVLLLKQEHDGGLSEPERTAKEKLLELKNILFKLEGM
jgi:hypothetical protein